MRALYKIEVWAMCLVLWILFGVVGLQFFTRYVLNDSFGWTEEVARMLLIVLTYIGAIVCARMGTHIRVDFIIEMFGDGFQRLYKSGVDLVSSGLFIFLGWTAAQFALKTRLEMSSIEFPKSIIFWICSGALYLMAFHYFIHFLSRMRSSATSKPGGSDDATDREDA